MSKKWGVEFDGVDKYLDQLRQIDGAAEKACTKALQATQEIVAQKCAAAMPVHRRTGRTAESIVTDGAVTWTQTEAEISVGFKISEGGLASIFLMHGTKDDDGKNLIKQDKALYDAVYGKETKREAYELQEAAFLRVVKEVMGT